MRPTRVGALFVCLLGLTAFAQAADYYLPQVANGSYGAGSFRTTFVFFNTNNTAVTARLELTGDQGGPLSMTIPGLGTGSQFTVTLPPGATRIYQTDGTGNLVAGGAHVTADDDIGVSAVFTVFTPGGNFQTEAGVGGSAGLTDFVIPVDVTGTFNTGVALYNPANAAATATLTLLNSSGNEVGQSTIPLVAHGHTAQFVTQLFPGTSNFRGTLRVTSPSAIAAVGLRQNEPPLSYTSLPAVPHSATQTDFNLPQVANGAFDGGSFKTTFVLFNISSSQANVSLALTKDDGSPFPVTIPGQSTNSTFNLTLAPGASAFLQTDGTGSLAAGAAKITSNTPLGAAAIFTVVDPQGGFQTESGVGDSPALTELTLPADVTGAFDTGIAFFVPGTSSVTLTMKLLDTSGTVVSTAQPLVLPGKTHSAKFVTQLFPGTSNFQGSIAITATGPVSALTLRQHSGPLSYTTLPVGSGASNGTQPQSGPLLSQTRNGVNVTSDSTLDVSLPGGFKISGNISGATLPARVVARSGATAYQGRVNSATHNYVVAVPAGTYNLTVCCAQASGLTDSLVYAFTDPAAVTVSGDTQHNIAVTPPSLFGISGTVSGLTAGLPTDQKFVLFTSSDNRVQGNFGIQSNSSYTGQLPNGTYTATVYIVSLNLVTAGFQISSIYNIGGTTVSGAALTANLTVPGTAQLAGTARIAGTPIATEGSMFFAQDKSAGSPLDADCAYPPAGSSSSLGTGGTYTSLLLMNRPFGIGVSVPVYRGATTTLAGTAMYPNPYRELSLGANTTSDFDLPAFPAQVRLTGKVTNGTGTGVKDVAVAAYSQELSGAPALSYSGTATTDANGNYELILLSGTNYGVTFAPPLPTP
jgi:hypothetical protein